MKYLLCLALALVFTASNAQTDITGSVGDALRRGDANSLGSFLLPQIDLTLIDFDGQVSKQDAQNQLTEFFAQHAPKDFVIKHQGTSKLDDQYRIGELITAKGSFRITFFMRKNGANLMIKQLKIEPVE